MGKRAFIICVAIVGVVVAGMLGVESWLRHSIRLAVERVFEGTGASVEMGRVSVSLPRRTISLHDVRIRAHGNDTSRRGYTVVSLDVTLPRITARGVGYDRVGERLSLSAGRLVIDSPSATLVTRILSGDSASTDGSKVVDSLPAVAPPELHVGEVSVTGAAFELVRWLSAGEHTSTTIGGVGLSARDVTAGSPPAAVNLTIDSIVHRPNGMKAWRLDTLALDTVAGTLALGNLALVPGVGKEQFAERSPDHADWTSIVVSGIACSGVDYQRLLTNNPTLIIDSLGLASASVASYKNRKVFSPPRTKSMLYEAIHRLPLPTEIGTLAFADLDVIYEELAEHGNTPGTITLTDGSGQAMNITNIPESHDRFMTVDLNVAFMQSGELEARFLFPIDPADDHWELSGRLGPTDMGAFNRVFDPLVSARVTSGTLRSLDFHIVGSAVRSHSRLTMAYNDLSVEFLDPHDHSRTRKFLTVIADGVFIRPDNPGRDGRGRLRTAESDYARDPRRSMWNYIWHSLQGAILKTVV